MVYSDKGATKLIFIYPARALKAVLLQSLAQFDNIYDICGELAGGGRWVEAGAKISLNS